MATKYKIGTISEILAKESGGGGQTADPQLAGLFSGGDASKVFRTVKVKEPPIQKKATAPAASSPPEKGTKKKKKDKLKVTKKDSPLKNKDAAGIRVGARKKVNIEIEDAASEPKRNGPVAADGKKVKKKKNKLQKKEVGSVQDETITSTAASGEGRAMKKAEKKNKKRKEKRKLKLEEGKEVPVVQAKKIKKDDASSSSPLKKSKVKKLKKKKGPKKADVKIEIKEENVSDDNDDGEEGEGEEIKATEATTPQDIFKTIAEKNAPKAKDPELEARTLFVGNLPGDTDKKLLLKMFKQYGKVETVRLRGGAPSKPTQLKKVAINKKELHSDKNTLTAYIRFVSREDAETAVNKGKGLMINENHLILDLADQGKKKDNKKAIFVGNLYMKLTDEELWRFFEDCGTILSVRVIRDNATGLGKGFGYVNFDEREAVDKALKKNQQELRNRTIRISRCVKKLKVKKGDVKKGGGVTKAPEGKAKEGKKVKPGKERWRNRVPADDSQEYSGDRLAEIGKLKRKSNKPNRGELRKAKIVKLLTGKAPARLPVPRFKANNASNNRPAPRTSNAKPKRYFN